MKGKIALAAGGTGGHLIPAQKVYDQLASDYEVVVAGVGLKGGSIGGQCYGIAGASPSLWGLIPFVWLTIKGAIQSIKLLKGAGLVIGFGSFHSFPVMLAAKLLRIPYILYEPNRIPGRVNRLFSRGARSAALLFQSLQTALPCATQTVAPLIHIQKSEKAQAQKELELNSDRPVLLVFGGSQGAKAINEALLSYVSSHDVPFQIYHICGRHTDPAPMEKAYDDKGLVAVVKQYEERMDLAWSAADVVICRSGANSVMEQIEYGVPALYVPYPYDRDGHQRANAAFVVDEVGGAMQVANSDLSGEVVAEKLDHLMGKSGEYKRNLEQYKSSLEARPFDELIRSVYGR